MRIGISGIFWPAVTTGSGQHLRGLLPALVASDHTVEYLLYIPRFAVHQNTVLDAPASIRIVNTPFDKSHANLAKVWYEQTALPAAARADGVDVLHIPYLGAPLRHKMPVVVTIHDLIPFILKEYRTSMGVRVYSRLVGWSARRAERVITVSASAARDVQRLLRIPSERIQVIYNALPYQFAPPEPEAYRKVAERLSLPTRYLVYLGGFDRRKNVPELLQAFAAIMDRIPDITLVIAGRLPVQDSAFAPDPQRLARELCLSKRVQFLGEVSEADKPAVYAGASALVFPSTYEGFGLPVLEASACGTPAVVCSGSSLEEVAGDGALYVSPGDVSALAQAMLRLVTETELRARLALAARAQAQRFSWETAARQTLAVYQAALQPRRSSQQ